jgi:hypothetical protein
MEWLILVLILGLTAINVPIGYALVLSTAVLLVAKGAGFPSGWSISLAPWWDTSGVGSRW